MSQETIKGKVWKFGDDVNTDLIIPARYLNTIDPAELASHVMEDEDPEFAGLVKPGDVIVAGRNFGCGSSREHAPVAIKAAGVAAVVAETFARIFFRNAINTGLPILAAPAAAAEAATGDRLEIDLEAGVVRNVTKGTEYKVHPFPPEMRRIIEAGGLMKFVAAEIRGGR